MPLIHLAFVGGQPLIDAHIGVSGPRAAAMTSAGLPVPPLVKVTLLIDTGASGVCIDQVALSSLGLVPTGAASMLTPSTGTTPHSCNLYDVSLLIPAASGAPFYLPAIPIMESNFQSQGIDGLLGRDVLAQCVLFYNSPLGGFTLAY